MTAPTRTPPSPEFKDAVEATVDLRLKRALQSVFYDPYERHAEHYALYPMKPGDPVCEFGMPVPPPNVMRGYKAAPENWLNNGKINTQTMFGIMRGAGCTLTAESRILDFGCGAARMTRWLRLLGEGNEYWGVDVYGPDIFWAKQALGRWLNIMTTTRLPHLPFEDGYFDFLFAGSVFSHIDDLAEAWLLELRRVVKRSGFLFVTVMDEKTIEILQSTYRSHLEKDVFGGNEKHIKAYDDYAASDALMFTVRRSPLQSLRPESPQVFYRANYLKSLWEKFFDVVDYRQQAYGYQSAVVLRKRLDQAPMFRRSAKEFPYRPDEGAFS